MTDRPSPAVYVVKRTFAEFSRDRCTDLAAALTYYSVLALFPAIVALTALLGVVGQAQQSIDTMIAILNPLVSDDVIALVEPVVRQLAQSRATGVALIVGLTGALWSASAYVNAFSRAMNQIYGVDEGRPIWKLRPQMLLITLVSLLLLAVAAVLLIVSGELTRSIGEVLGFGETAATIWNVAKWPALATVVLFLVTLLYRATPNVKHEKFRALSPGALLTLVTGLLASVGFTFYVANFGSYDRTYGSLAGVIVALLFLWICNLVLLLGAELDVEFTRMKQLGRGLAAETSLQLPMRDTRQVEKSRRKEWEQVTTAREIRVERAEEHLVPGQDPIDTDRRPQDD